MGLVAALTAVSVGTQLVTSSAQSKAQKAQGEFEAQQLETNARLSGIQADDAIRRGEKDVSIHNREIKLLIGDQRAALAAQGYDLGDDDDAMAIQQDTAGFGAEDAETIRNNAWREAWGYRAQATNLQSQAGFTRITGSSNAKQTFLTGGLKALQSGTSSFLLSQRFASRSNSTKSSPTDATSESVF